MAAILWKPGIIKICTPGEQGEKLPDMQEPCFHYIKHTYFNRCRHYRPKGHYCDFITVLPEDEE